MRPDELVGRREQVELLRDAARLAGSGSPQFVVLSGEAGVGKTFLMDRFATELGASGALVLRGGCRGFGEDGFPLVLVTTVLRQLIASQGTECVTAGAPGAEALLGLLPELGKPRTGPESQARLFDLFCDLLRRLSATQAVLLLVEDLQHAGASIRELLGYLARTLHTARVLVLTAYRTGEVDRRHPLRPFLAEFGRLPGARRVDVSPFSRAELAEFVSVVRHGPVPARLVDRVYRRSGGNALFAEELVKAGDDTTVPDSLRDLLVHRIDQLPEATVRIVHLAALGGEHVSHRLLTTSAHLTEPELLVALRPAVDAGVLIPSDRGGDDGYAFRHALLREAVLDDLLPADRARLHRVYASVLEAEPTLVPGERFAAEVAFHWDGAGDLSKALPALVQAAEDAAAVFAHAEQSRLLARALSLWPRIPPDALPRGIDRLDLFVSAITAALWVGESLDALDLIDRALAEINPAHRPDQAALVLAERAMVLHELERHAALTAVTEAMELVPPEPTPVRAQVLALCAAVWGLRGHSASARDAAEEAARIATTLGDTRIEGAARTTLAMTLNQLGDHDAALVQVNRARTLAARQHDLIGLARAQLNLVEALDGRGRYREAADAAVEGIAVARRAGVDRSFGAMIAGYLAQARAAAGELAEADDICLAALRDDPAASAGAVLHGMRTEIALIQGRWEGARQQLGLARALLGTVTEPPPWLHLAIARQDAELALTTHRVDEAADIVGDALTVVGTKASPRQLWPLLLTGARIERYHRTHKRARTAPSRTDDLAKLLRASAAELAADTPLTAAYATQFAAEFGDDGGSWPDAVAAWEACDHPYAAAEARLRAAEAALASGDRTAAAELLQLAGDQAQRLGAEPLRQEIALLARNARLPMPAARENGEDPDELARFGLTSREVEVLRLVAVGRSNRRIADELFISVKTVSVHVSNILAKLGVAGRGEAATVFHRLDGDQPG